MYRHRLLETTLPKIEKTFPVIVITGPRQSGKSTLLKHYLSHRKATHLSLEDSNLRALIMADPLHFLERQPKPVILDEVQELPELVPYVKILVDKNRQAGRWFITGSQQFSVMKNVSESLAGRAAILTLPPFQIQERKNIADIEDFLYSSSYPEPAVNKKVDLSVWYSSYVQTYLERDVRKLLHVAELRDFEQFLRLSATRTAQELHYSGLASDLGISVPTVKRWVSVLEASYIVFLLPPYFRNLGKRIIKAPKLYFLDVGLLNYFLGVKKKEHVLQHPMAGALFETAVMGEIMKKKFAEGIKPELYYWRSQSGLEVDLIIPRHGTYEPCEIKMSSTVKPSFTKNLHAWLELSKKPKNAKGYLITNCAQDMPLPSNIQHIYWKHL